MMLAVEQLLQMNYMPRWIAWESFHDHLRECLTWATIQRDKIKFAAKQANSSLKGSLKEKRGRRKKGAARLKRRSGASTSPIGKPGNVGQSSQQLQQQLRTGGNSSSAAPNDGLLNETETAFSNHIMLPTAVGPQSLIDAEELVSGLAQRMRGTELDYRSNRTERHFPVLRQQIERKILAAQRSIKFGVTHVISAEQQQQEEEKYKDFQLRRVSATTSSSSSSSSSSLVQAAIMSPLDVSVLYRPSSPDRKKRRLLFYASIFNVVAHGTDMLDVAELKAFLKSERDQFCKLLALIKDGTVTMPIISRGYNRQEVEGSHSFSVVRALICCHLWNSSSQLHKLFENFDAQGLAVVSLTGFVRAAEACFLTVSDNLGVLDDVLADFVDIAVKDAQFRRAPAVFISQQARALAAAVAVTSAAAAMARGSVLAGNNDRRGSRLASMAQSVKARSSMVGKGRQAMLQNDTSNPNAVYDPEEAPPTVYLRCEYHGAEDFFFADLCCCKCEDEAWKALSHSS